MLIVLSSPFWSVTPSGAQGTIAIEEWVEPYNSPCGGHGTVRDMALDSAANVYVIAFHNCLVELRLSSLIKYDTNGIHQWTLFFPHNLNAVTVDAADNVYVTGGAPDLVTSKYSPAGAEIWTNIYDSTVPPGDPHNETGYKIVLDGLGNVYVAGGAGTRLTSGIYDADEDYLTVKYNAATGARAWARQFDRLSGFNHLNDRVRDLAVDGSGNVAVTGFSGIGVAHNRARYLTLKYDAAGSLVWSATYGSPFPCCTNPDRNEAFAVGVDSIGDVYVTGMSGPAPGFYDLATVKYAAATGAELWAARYDGGTCWDEGHDLIVDSSDDVYVTGQSCVGYSTLKYDPAGNQLWVATYSNGDGGDDAQAMALDATGNVYVTGSSLNTAGGTGWDFATVAYDTLGSELWSIRYTGTSTVAQEIAVAIDVDAAQNVYITGQSPDALGVMDVITIKYSQQVCTAEICDALDNDCNALVDDGIPDQETGTDVGECQIEIQSCISGGFQIIQPGIGPTSEICDGLDNDCEGTIDNGIADITSGSDVGECRVEIQSCSGGAFLVTQTAIGPTSEICDGLDNDCEGTIDNGIVDIVSGTDVGECRVEIQSCSGGAFLVAQTGIGPIAELCDGLDNDCNGVGDVTQGICNTPPASGPTKFTDPSGNASVEFPDVAVGGETTVREIACTVNVPDGYTLNTSALCYEIESTADSTSGEKIVCIRYPIPLDPDDLAPTAILKCESAGVQNCCAVALNGTGGTCGVETYFVSLGAVPPPPSTQFEACISVTTLSDFAFAQLDAGLDSDFDSVPDVSDNCPSGFNPLQEDGEFDGIGDVCDNCAAAPNGPSGGTCTAGDEATLGRGCASHAECGTAGFCSTAQQDVDSDGVGDACDPTKVPFYVADVFDTPDCFFGGGCTPADFPLDWGALRTFQYGMPPGHLVYEILISGTWGGDVFGGTAPVEVYLEGYLVTECQQPDPCWGNASTVDWNDGSSYSLSSLGVDFSDPVVQALFADGDAQLSFVQNDEISINVSNLQLDVFVPEPSGLLGLAAGGIALVGLIRLRRPRVERGASSRPRARPGLLQPGLADRMKPKQKPFAHGCAAMSSRSARKRRRTRR